MTKGAFDDQGLQVEQAFDLQEMAEIHMGTLAVGLDHLESCIVWQFQNHLWMDLKDLTVNDLKMLSPIDDKDS